MDAVNTMKILMLEDSADRIAAFRAGVATLGAYELVVWRAAPDMIRELPVHLGSAALISLDHDLVQDEGEPDPGDGLQVAEALAKQTPVCPVILHTSNVTRMYSMRRELEDGGWTIVRVGPVGMGEDWIPAIWLPAVRQLLAP